LLVETHSKTAVENFKAQREELQTMKDIECAEAQEACTAEREQAQERLQEVKNTLWKDVSRQVRSHSLG
jgi:hypothetical protein